MEKILKNHEHYLLLSAVQFIEDFYKEYEERKSKLPYHVNLIDDLGANENAHSRILVRFLGYHRNGQYPVLKSFIDFQIKNQPGFDFSHQVLHPVITSESHRIDALIREGNYAIIIENKIHYAEDQQDQLLRYIDKVRSFNIKDENIYVIYITRDGGPPDENSFPGYEIERFKGRYLELSYKYDILPWLEELSKNDFVTEHQALYTALIQYTDHLKGLFDLRENEKTMKEELLQYLEAQLDLPGDVNGFPEQIEILNNKMEQISKTQEYLNSLIRTKAINYWKTMLETDFPQKSRDQMLYFNCDKINSYPKMGIIHKYKEWNFIIVIGMDTKPYYGIMSDLNSKKTIPEVNLWLASEIAELKNRITGWYGFMYIDYNKTYACFKDLAERILSKT